jgi:poly(hydroxyalkanoate) granule-associated protein
MSRKETVMENAKKVGDDVKRLGRNAYLAGLGVVVTAEEEACEVFDRLVAKGESFEKSEKNLVGLAFDKLTGLGRRVGDAVTHTVSATLQRAGIPSRDEIRTLIERVDELSDRVEKLSER